MAADSAGAVSVEAVSFVILLCWKIRQIKYGLLFAQEEVVTVAAAEATATGTEETVEVVVAQWVGVVVLTAEADVVVAAVVVEAVVRNVKEIGPAETVAIRTSPGGTSAIVVSLRRVRVPLAEVVAAAAVVVSVVAAEDRSVEAHEAEVAIGAASAVAAEAEVAVVVPCVEGKFRCIL